MLASQAQAAVVIPWVAKDPKGSSKTTTLLVKTLKGSVVVAVGWKKWTWKTEGAVKNPPHSRPSENRSTASESPHLKASAPGMPLGPTQFEHSPRPGAFLRGGSEDTSFTSDVVQVSVCNEEQMYTGDVLKGSETGGILGIIPHGVGTYRWLYRGYPDAYDEYVGEFRDGDRRGTGTYTYADGARFIGQWDQDARNGKGTMTWPHGVSYSGEYLNDAMHGRGIMTWASGLRYDGEWSDSKQHGRGKLFLPNGDTCSDGEWIQRKYQRSGKATKKAKKNAAAKNKGATKPLST